MPTINPVLQTAPISFIHVLWENMATGDTFVGFELQGTAPLAGFVQATGTFGSATVKLQGSNDNTNWVNLKDTAGTEISFTAAGGADFSTSARYIRAYSSGGTSDSIDVSVCFRG